MSEHDNLSSSPSKSSSSGETLPSTSRSASVLTRIQRNVAEKQRRDKLNGYISELANIVPMVSMSSKRLDKTSILRLSAAHLRLSKSPLSGNKKPKKSFKWCPNFLTGQQVRDILESVDGFLIVTSSSGKILFTSSSVERYLGHQNIDMIGHSLFVFIHPEDLDCVKKEMERLLTASLKCSDSGPAPRCSFRCRMKEKGQPRSEVATYQFVHFVGDMTISDEDGVSCKNVKSTAIVTHIFKSFVRIVDADPYSQLSLEDATADEYVTRHSLDGTIIFADHRLSTITGHLPQEVMGLSAYKYILPEDISIALFAHHLMFSSDKGTGMIVYRLRTQDDKFVYLKSVGCLQFDRATSQVDHFVCVNQHLSDVEGEEQLKYFVDRFIPHIRDSSAVTLFESVKALQVMGVKPPKRIGGINEDIISRFPTKDVKIRISDTTNSSVSSDKISKETVGASVFESVKTVNGPSVRTSKSISTSKFSSLKKVSVDKSVITDISLTTLMKPVQCKKKSKQPSEAESGSKKRKAANNVSVSSGHSDNNHLSVKSNSSLVLDKVKPTSPSNHAKNNDVNLMKVLTSNGFISSQSVQNISIKQEVSEINELQSDAFSPRNEKTKLVFDKSNPITNYQDVIKSSNGQISRNLNIVKIRTLQKSEILKDNSYLLLSQAGNIIPNGFHASESKSYSEFGTDSDGPKTVNALNAKNLSGIKSNVCDIKSHDEDSKIVTSMEDSSELMKLDIDSVSVNGVNVNFSDSNQLSSNEHDTILTETNLWPVESSSESSASNAVSEETVGSSVECCGDEHNLYLMPEGEMKEYLGCVDDISTILNSTLPIEDSSLPSIDGWSEFLRPEDMLCSATESLVDADQPLIDAFVEKSLNSW